MTDQEQIAKLQLALCLAKKECPNHNPQSEAQDDYMGGQCRTCHGTTKVPLLEGVREKCRSCDGKGKRVWKFNPKDVCPNCQGRAWVPNTDPFKYAIALYHLWEHDVRHDQELLEIGFGVFKGELVLLSNIAKALGVGQ